MREDKSHFALERIQKYHIYIERFERVIQKDTLSFILKILQNSGIIVE
jgi:hypothetical protein